MTNLLNFLIFHVPFSGGVTPPKFATGLTSLDQKLISAYLFDVETDIGKDSNNQFNGTIIDGGATVVHPTRGRILRFAASDPQTSRLSISNSSVFSITSTSSFCASFWVKFLDLPPSTAYGILGKDDFTGVGREWVLFLRASNQIKFYTESGLVDAQNTVTVDPMHYTVYENVWYHVYISYDHTIRKTTLELNGLKIEDYNLPGAIPTTSAPVTVGSDNRTGGLKANMDIDKLYFFNQILTDDEKEYLRFDSNFDLASTLISLPSNKNILVKQVADLSSRNLTPSNPQYLLDVLAKGHWIDGKVGQNYQDTAGTTLSNTDDPVGAASDISSSGLAISTNRPTQKDTHLEFSAGNYLELSSLVSNGISKLIGVFVVQGTGFIFTHRSVSEDLIRLSTTEFYARDGGTDNVLNQIAITANIAIEKTIVSFIVENGNQKLRINGIQVGAITPNISQIDASTTFVGKDELFPNEFSGIIYGFYISEIANEVDIPILEEYFKNYYATTVIPTIDVRSTLINLPLSKDQTVINALDLVTQESPAIDQQSVLDKLATGYWLDGKVGQNHQDVAGTIAAQVNDQVGSIQAITKNLSGTSTNRPIQRSGYIEFSDGNFFDISSLVLDNLTEFEMVFVFKGTGYLFSHRDKPIDLIRFESDTLFIRDASNELRTLTYPTSDTEQVIVTFIMNNGSQVVRVNGVEVTSTAHPLTSVPSANSFIGKDNLFAGSFIGNFYGCYFNEIISPTNISLVEAFFKQYYKPITFDDVFKNLASVNRAAAQSAVAYAISETTFNNESVLSAFTNGNWFDGKVGQSYQDIGETNAAIVGSLVGSVRSITTDASTTATIRPTQQDGYIQFQSGTYLDLSDFISNSVNSLQLTIVAEGQGYIFTHRSESTDLIRLEDDVLLNRDSTNALQTLNNPSNIKTQKTIISIVVENGNQKVRVNGILVDSDDIALNPIVASKTVVGTDFRNTSEPFNGKIYGFHISETVEENNLVIIEKFFENYYSDALQTLDLSALTNLPDGQKELVVNAAIAAASGSETAQDIIDEIAKTEWVDFLPISTNLKKSNGDVAGEGELVETIDSVTGNTYTRNTGTGGTKTIDGLTTSLSSYSGNINQRPNMTFVGISSFTSTDPSGDYYYDIGIEGNPNRRIFEAKTFGTNDTIGYYDGGSAHIFSPTFTPDSNPHIDSFVVTGAQITFRKDGNNLSTNTVISSPSINNATVRLFGTNEQRLDGNVRGFFYAPENIDIGKIERFANKYYRLNINLPSLDLSLLPNLPALFQTAVAAAAISSAMDQSYSAADVITALSQSYWFNGVNVVADGLSSGTVNSWGLTKEFTSPVTNQPTQTNQGLSFDGVDDYLSAGTGINFSDYVSIQVDAPNVDVNDETLHGSIAFGVGANNRFSTSYGGFSAEQRFLGIRPGANGSTQLKADISSGTFNIISHTWVGGDSELFFNSLLVGTGLDNTSLTSSDQSAWELRLGQRFGTTFTSNGNITIKGVFLSPAANRVMLERFANQYYALSITQNDLDLSGLSNLQAIEAVATAAIATAAGYTYSAQDVINEIIKTEWIDFLSVGNNLLTSGSATANIGENINSIKTVTSDKTFTLSIGDGAVKTATGITATGDRYGGTLDRGNTMTTIFVGSNLTHTAEQRFLALSPVSPTTNLKIFAISNDSRLTYYPATTATFITSNVSINDNPHVVSWDVNGSDVNFRVDGNIEETGSTSVQTGLETDIDCGYLGGRNPSSTTALVNADIQGSFHFASDGTSDVDVLMLERFANKYYGLNINTLDVDLSALPNLPVAAREVVTLAANTASPSNPQSVIDAVASFDHWYSVIVDNSFNDLIGNENWSTAPGYQAPTLQTGAENYLSFNGTDQLYRINTALGLNGATARTFVLLVRGVGAPNDFGFLTIDSDITNAGSMFSITDEINVRVIGNRQFDQALPTTKFSLLAVRCPLNATATDITVWLDGQVLNQIDATDTALNTENISITLGGRRFDSVNSPTAIDVAEVLFVNEELSIAQLDLTYRFLNALGNHNIELNPNLSALINLSNSEKLNVENAALAINASNPKSIIDTIAQFNWINGRVGANYTDAARTTLAQINDPIATSLLIESNNAAVQTTANEQPIQRDGYIEFDGTNDNLLMNEFVPSNISQLMAVFVIKVSSSVSDTPVDIIFGHRSETTQLIQLGLRQDRTFQIRDSTNSALQELALSEDPKNDIERIISIVFDKAGNQKLRLDGQEVSAGAITYSGNFNSTQTILGGTWSSSGTANFFQGNLYGAFITDRVDEAQLEVVERFADNYYELGVLPLDFSTLPNLPASQQSSVQAAAIAAAESQSYSAQDVINELALTEWFDFTESSNVQKADGNPAQNGENVETIISSSTGATVSYLTGNRATKTIDGVSVAGSGYQTTLDVNNFMSITVVGSNFGNASGLQYLLDLENPRRIFTISGSGPSVGKVSYFDGATIIAANKDTDDSETIWTTKVSDTLIEFRQDLIQLNSGTVDSATPTSSVNAGLFSRVGQSNLSSNADFRGIFYADSNIDVEKIERFANEYYNLNLISSLDFSALTNLPVSEQAAVESAARRVNSASPQTVIDAIANSYWWNGVGVVANGQPSGTIDSWGGLQKQLTSTSYPTQDSEGLSFDGTANYLSAGTNINLDSFRTVTVASFDSVGTIKPIYGFAASVANRINLQLRPEGDVAFFGDSFVTRSYSPVIANLNKFQIWSSSWNTTILSITQNQVADTTGGYSLTSTTNTNTWEFRIGAAYGGGGTFNNFGKLKIKGFFLSDANQDVLEQFANEYYGINALATGDVVFTGLTGLPDVSRGEIEAAAKVVDSANPQRVVDAVANNFQHWFSSALAPKMTLETNGDASTLASILSADEFTAPAGLNPPVYNAGSETTPTYLSFNASARFRIASLLGIGGTSARTIILCVRSTGFGPISGDDAWRSTFFNLNSDSIVSEVFSSTGSGNGRLLGVTPQIRTEFAGFQQYDQSLTDAEWGIITVQNNTNDTIGQTQVSLNGTLLGASSGSNQGDQINILGTNTTLAESIRATTDYGDVLIANTVVDSADVDLVIRFINALNHYGVTIS